MPPREKDAQNLVFSFDQSRSHGEGMSEKNDNEIPGRKKVIAIDAHRPPSKEAIHLLHFADKLDEVIKAEMAKGVTSPREIAGIVAHRLGTMLRLIERNEPLWTVLKEIIERQANIENKGTAAD